ncbi:MAG TPA: Na-translocating system protein MpsC family protein [Thermoleophilaceae bacterium]
MRQSAERMDGHEDGRQAVGSKMLQVSNAIVGLHKEFYGRGPTKARSTLARDVLVVVLEGGFSQAERTLAQSGRTEAVSDARRVMQSVIKDRWVEAVEELLGRQVSCFLSANDPLKEIQIETFILEPVPAAEDGALAEIYTTHQE